MVLSNLFVLGSPLMDSIRSTFEVDTTDPDKPTLRLEVMIDGKPAYQYVLSTTQVHEGWY